MAQVLVTESYLDNIADAIRDKNGSEDTYTPAQMAGAIEALPDAPVLVPKSITANGTYSPASDDADGYSGVTVNVANSYAAGDEGKVVSNGALVSQSSQNITENGTYDTTLKNQVVVNVSGGGGSADTVKGFEIYEQDFVGGSNNTVKGVYNNNYFVCYFHDNMSSSYQLNGTSYTYSVVESGKGSGSICATTKAVTNGNNQQNDAIIRQQGSQFTSVHGDSGSYMSFVGGWVGYPDGGTIYENEENGTTNSITLNSAHDTLLVVFVATNTGLGNVSSIDINGTTYSVENKGYKYDGVYALYGIHVIKNNLASTITVTISARCYSYLSIIGIDS